MPLQLQPELVHSLADKPILIGSTFSMKEDTLQRAGKDVLLTLKNCAKKTLRVYRNSIMPFE